MKSRGLLIIYNAHNLLEFIWYYCSYKEARNIEWDALCLPSGVKGEYMTPYCEKSGIFANIYNDDKAYSDDSFLKQLGLFAKMFGYFIVGRRRSFCKKTLNKYVDIDKYEHIAALSDFGIVSGMAVGLGKDTVIFEDGTADYKARSYMNIFKNFFNFFAWKGFILSMLGYANTAYFYPLRTTSECIKFSSHPEIMPYKKYKEIRLLFDFSNTDTEKYDSIITHLYNTVKDYDFSSVDTVLFTNNLSDFVNIPDNYIKRLEKYISGTSVNLLVKKHPRDTTDYVFSDDMTVQEVDQTLPAEVILSYIRNKKVIFLAASSIILYMRASDYDLECTFFSGMSEESEKQITHAKYLPKNELKRMFEKFGVSDIKFVEI